MKHAFLITAYKNAPQLVNLIKHLNSQHSYFFIHIDKKSCLLKDPLILNLKSKQNVVIDENPINVNWGGFSHLKAIISLIKLALTIPTISYLHTLSGQCFPIKPLNEILNFFEKNNGNDYMDYYKMPTTRLIDGGMNRLHLYRLNDIFDEKGTFIEKRINSTLINIQKKLKMQRPYSKKFPPPYWGSTWWSLSRRSLEYVINYITDNPEFYKRFNHTFCAEEMFFQTILVNSVHKVRIVNENLRFLDWTERNGNSPANLDETDFISIKNSNKLFARKFDSKISLNLIQLLSIKNNKQ